jgi:hypothetical protein
MLPSEAWHFHMSWLSRSGFAVSSEQLYLFLFEQKEGRNEGDMCDLPITAAECSSWSSVLIGYLTLASLASFTDEQKKRNNGAAYKHFCF